MHSVRAYKMIFAVLDRRLIQRSIKWLQFFVKNICSFINTFTPWCRIPKLCYHDKKGRYCAKCLQHV